MWQSSSKFTRTMCRVSNDNIWDALDAGEVYPNLQPHKKSRGSTKLELTKDIKKHCKFKQKKERQIWYLRACTCIQRGVRNQYAKEYYALLLFSYWYVQLRFIFETSFDCETNSKSCQVCPGSIG